MGTTLSPTLSMTTNDPTAMETELSTTFSPTAKTTTTSDVPTDTPTASPTAYPTFLPTILTLEPTSADTTFEPTTTEPCMDDPELSFKNDIIKDCSWVGKRSVNRCERKWNGKKLLDFCPATCGMCPPTASGSSRRQLLRGQK